MKYTIEIRDNKKVLSITLSDLLTCIDSLEDYNWKIVWLTATSLSENFSVSSLEEDINNSESGYPISPFDLINFNKKFSQIIEIMLVGDKDISKLIRYNNDTEMKKNCTFCIELVDSSYWEVTSNNEKTLQNISEKFRYTKYLDNEGL